MNVYLYTTHITYCLKAQSPQISHICGLYGRPPFWCANRLQNSRELKQTFLNHGRQTEVETSPLWCVLHPFYSKSQVVNAKMRALQLIGRAWKRTKSKNINFRLTSLLKLPHHLESTVHWSIQFSAISFPDAAILLVSDGDPDFQRMTTRMTQKGPLGTRLSFQTLTNDLGTSDLSKSRQNKFTLKKKRVHVQDCRLNHCTPVIVYKYHSNYWQNFGQN